ncbi:D-2-hydroxyacid dehydrogenase [Agrobacterium vitis]|uniref:D-2-hydroxyacid dehydrogenase n=1 Tax=Agrobacterium vitis TaxID=373 RepID=A0A6L6VKD3_AGRVI|nr:D-2-hydroxyacid dehydrogenase [Agrobacterium vitis]MUZ76016.1 D-2-hydroxyacid dehydrogenase [Agrobacterium vitis]
MVKALIILSYGEEAAWCASKLEAQFPEHEWRLWDAANPGDSEAECLVGIAPLMTAEMIAKIPGLKWIHALTTGVDNLIEMTELPQGVVVTNTSGIHGPQMSELAIMMMLALPRQLPRLLANQAEARWDRFPQPLLLGKSVCIVGVGAVAMALAPRCAAFGMTVIGVSDRHSTVEGFERIYPPDQLIKAVSNADFVVVLTPYTTSTHHIISDAVLSAMPPGAYLVNIARGGCVDEAALMSHMHSGSIAGAALDVFSTEPLPQEHPFWAEPKVIVTPHIGGMSNIYAEQALPIFERHLDALRRNDLSFLPDMRR